ncbi:MAG: TonB-dependent receptor [Rubrivivax sp.]|nr:TonB-dependent receptor [Rubrivivax sp.]
MFSPCPRLPRAADASRRPSLCGLAALLTAILPIQALSQTPPRPAAPAGNPPISLPVAAPASTEGRSLADLLQAPATSTVVVTATRTPQRIDQALADVSVIDRAQIEAAGGRTLADLLSRQAGVQSWANGGLGAPASVSLRGMESRHTLLLIDGVRYGSATLGTPIWDNLPLDLIERIEIVRGPMSALYGSDAVGGVVQIFTRSGSEGLRPDASLTAGSRGYGEAAAGLRLGSGPLDAQLRLQHLRTRGASATNERVPFGQFNADDDGFRQSSAQARLGLRLGTWRAEALLLAADGQVAYDDGPGADARADVRTALQSLSLSGTLASGWKTTLRAARSEDINEVLASASPWAQLGATGTVQRQLSWENQIDTPWGQAFVLAEGLTQTVRRPGTPYDVSRRSINGLALGLNGSSGRQHWQGQLRRDRNSQFGSPTTGTLAYGLDLLPGVRLGFSTGKSFVAPSFNQLYFPGFGNPALLPEEGLQNELSLRWQGAGSSVRMAWFDHRIRGYISSGAQPTNIPRTRVDGLSASAETLIGPWSLSVALDLLNPRNDTAGSANAGKRLPRRAAESLRLAADWQGRALRLGGSFVAQGERFDDAANTRRLPGHALLDLRADWTLAAAWTLGLKLNNALGQRYETTYGYNAPGREAFVTLRWAQR